MDIFDQLNEEQLAAVTDESNACIVNANVGSGKTTVLISKIFYLHHEKGVSFQDMFVLTFTNKAADEIKARITLLDKTITENEMLYFGTFHSVALKLLKDVLPVESLGVTKDFTIVSPDEELEMAKTIITQHRLTIKYESQLLKRIENAKRGKILHGNMKKPDAINTLIDLLSQEKIRQNKMSFDDLIQHTTALLQQYTFSPAWIIIDEFQDSNSDQLQLIKAVSDDHTKLFVVGDPNQVIYSWRGSRKDIFETFQEDYHARVLSLPQNYRSCTNILNSAKCFLETTSDLIGVREPGNKIIIKNHYNPFQEAQYLTERITENLQSGMQYNDIAILYRLQKQSEILENVFTKCGIPYEVSKHKTLRDIPVLNWVMNLLAAAVNSDDTNALMSVLCNSKYGEHLDQFQANVIVNTQAPEKSFLFDKIADFKNWCQNKSCLTQVYEYFRINEYINPTSSAFPEDQKYIDDLFGKIDEYIRFQNVDLFTGLQQFINSAALFGVDILKDDIHLENNTVKLMTLHSSKGMEFKQVYIIGVNPGLIPLHTTMDEEEEERRLFFVGMTRAKDHLELSYYTSPDDMRVSPGKSYYLSFIPPMYIEEEQVDCADTDLQLYRHEVAETRHTNQLQAEQKQRMVRHQKYGTGTVTQETEDSITVCFEGYGEKEFLKMFSEFEDV